MVQIQNLLQVSTLRLDVANNVVGNNVGAGADVTIQWVDTTARTANLFIASAGMFIGINAENKLVAAVNPKTFKLELQDNATTRIRVLGDDTNVVVLDKPVGPATNQPVAPTAKDLNKQFWNFV